MSEQDENVQNEQKLDFASVFPAKGDPRRPPEWYGRALLYAAIAVFLAYFVWHSWSSVSGLFLDIIISLFLTLALEPMVLILVRHGWKRGVASVVSLLGLAVIIIVLLAMFGNLFVQQVMSMVSGLPDIYEQISSTVEEYTSFEIPQIESLINDAVSNFQTSWVADVAGQAVDTVVGVVDFLLDLVIVVMVTFYLSAAGPKLKRSLCQWFAPSAQSRFLTIWTIVQDQISNFLFSRTILAALNAFFMAIFLDVIHVQYWLPLSLFCGIVSQFVPTVGTYIGGALPVLFAWGGNGFAYAVGVLVYIIIYQQIENLILSPKISQRTMALNPAIAFLAVMVFANLFGALGGFLALPITASLQAIIKLYTKRYDLVDSPLLDDPKPVKKSKVVKGAEAFSEHVIKPVSDHMPRAARGSTARVPADDDIEKLRELYQVQSSEELDASETVAIPKNILSKTKKKGLVGGEATEEESRGNVSDSQKTDSADTGVGKTTDTADGGVHNGFGVDATHRSAASSTSSAHTGSAENTAENTTDNVSNNVRNSSAKSSSRSQRTPSDDNPRSRWS